MKKIILIIFFVSIALLGLSQISIKEKEKKITFSVICLKQNSLDRPFKFILEIHNFSREGIEIPKNYYCAPNHDIEGNLGFELLLLDRNDTIKIHDSIDEDKVIRPGMISDKVTLRQGESYLKEARLLRYYFSKKGTYLVRFTLRKNFWNPGYHDLLTSWFTFTVN